MASSRASSRASSPGGNDSTPSSPVQLTPTSKVKAMLAALDDDDSDCQPAPGPEKQKSVPNVNSTPTSIHRKGFRAATPPKGKPSTTEDSESEEDQVVFRPRGRVAAAMKAAQDEAEGGQSQGVEMAPDTVSDQVTSRARGLSNDDIEKSHSARSNEDDTPVITRKRRIRRGRDSTPASRPNKDSSTSPSMFISPIARRSASPTGSSSDSDPDLPANPAANARFIALIEAKRKERIAKEAEIQRQKAERAAKLSELSKRHSDVLEEDAMDYSDDEDGRRLTQQARPTRKASKKALEEMHRETQRMSRNMQLAHEAKTKKKITKSSLFAKFNYKPAGFVEDNHSDPIQTTSSSPAPQTDSELKDTPPTSPALSTGHVDRSTLDGMKVPKRGLIGAMGSDNEDIPSLNDALSENQASSPSHRASKRDKGKGRALEEPETSIMDHAAIETNRVTMDLPPLRIRPEKVQIATVMEGNDSDSDLEIVHDSMPGRKKKDSVFDRVPSEKASQSHSLHALRMLAHITSPSKQANASKGKNSMNAAELQFSLQQRARQQALREREERLQALRDSGVVVQTTEEREREMADVEDLVAKARREGDEIMKRENLAAKMERRANGEVDQPSDNSEDEEWQEEKEKFAGQVSGSGSDSDGDDEADGDESEEAISADEDDEMADSLPGANLIEHEASATDSEEDEAEASAEESARISVKDHEDQTSNVTSDDDMLLPGVKGRRRTKNRVVSDEEDEEDEEDVEPSKLIAITSPTATRTTDSPKVPHSVLRSATKTFIPGLTVSGPAGLGLTQIFAGTMDDSQFQCHTSLSAMRRPSVMEMDTQQDSLAFLQNLPQTGFPTFEPTPNDDSQDMIRDSQTQMPESPLAGYDSQEIRLHFAQSQIHGFDSMISGPSATQMSDFPEPTQDCGLQEISPIKGRFLELAPSTIDTLVLEETPIIDRVAESPVVKRKGKLRRKAEMINSADNDTSESSKPIVLGDADEFEIPDNLFDIMRKASRRREAVVDEFNKKTSGAKEMVQEQAEESEDEYAGLGGASDDDSGGEDAYAKEIIDDESKQDVDESKLAAFYADKERVSDEKQVEKLFKDITNGMLRRKRGADYDLSDSDDGGEARRRMKRKEFAKMRKALLEDERIGKIAENPKKLPFLLAIEDRGGDDEVDFLDEMGETQDTPDSQSQAQVEGSQEQSPDATAAATSMGPPKRKLPIDSQPEKRLPPHLRRTQAAKRPSNLSEIRESLSSLIDDPNAILPSQELSGSGSDSEGDENRGPKETEKENRDPFASRRKANISVVDRMSLKRADSNTTSTSVRLAFAAPSAAAAFKVPALLRRSTTTSSISSGSSSTISGTERMAGGLGDKEKFTKKAGKNSGVNYFARENERRTKLEASENKRKEKRWKGAEGRRKAVGGLFGRGKFE